MKFQIVFLSLFLAATAAQHEPKSLRGGDEEEHKHDHDLEELIESTVTVVPRGSSATIQCGRMSLTKCCVTGSFQATSSNSGIMTIGSGWGYPNCDGAIMTNGKISNCESDVCRVSCGGDCNVIVRAGGAGPPARAGGGGRGGGGRGGLPGRGFGGRGRGGAGRGRSGHPYASGKDEDDDDTTSSTTTSTDTHTEEE
eukprot:scaffold35177_cov161-Skeletonema_dohrnii-CCMP3373.AAC.3